MMERAALDTRDAGRDMELQNNKAYFQRQTVPGRPAEGDKIEDSPQGAER